MLNPPGIHSPSRFAAPLVTVGLIIIAAVFWTIQIFQEEARLVDDAFISFRYAENFLRGYGLVYNHGERVEGYSNFLWVILVALGMAFGMPAEVSGKFLGLFCWLGIILACGLLAARGETAVKKVLGALLLALLLLPRDLVAFSGTGLETALVSVLTLLTVLSQTIWRPESRGARLACGLFPILLCLTRLDFIIVAAVAISWPFFHQIRPYGLRHALHDLAGRSLPFLIALGSYLLWKLWYYGSLFPNSFYAKDHDRLHLEAGFEYLISFLQSFPHTILLLGVAVFALGTATRSPEKLFLSSALACLAAYTMFVVCVGGDFMYFRFFFQVYPLLVAAGIVAFNQIQLSVPKSGTLVVASLLLSAFARPVLAERYHMETLDEMYNCCTVIGTRVGTFLRNRLPPDTAISTTMAGAIAFYSRLRTVDQLGLNDKTVAAQNLTDNWFKRGHMKAASFEYLRERGVNLVLGHPQICSCAAPCFEDLPNVFLRLNEHECLRSYYLAQNDALTEHLCNHPESFLLHRVSCSRALIAPLRPKAESEADRSPRVFAEKRRKLAAESPSNATKKAARE